MYYYQQYQGRSQKSAMGRGWACAEGLETQLRDPGAKYPCSEILNFFFFKNNLIYSGGVEDRKLEAKAKNTQKKKIRGEGQGQPN